MKMKWPTSGKNLENMAQFKMLCQSTHVLAHGHIFGGGGIHVRLTQNEQPRLPNLEIDYTSHFIRLKFFADCT